MKLKQDEPPGAIAKQATQEVQDLISARLVADMIGVAAELQLADFINTGAKTAEEIAKTKGLHATSLYRLPDRRSRLLRMTDSFTKRFQRDEECQGIGLGGRIQDRQAFDREGALYPRDILADLLNLSPDVVSPLQRGSVR
jgi:hypothetical protein